MAKKPPPKDAVTSALHILALREHTCFELAQKLKLRGFTADEIETALNQCRQWNYLNDARAARILAKSLVRKGYGLNKIEFELKKRKIAADDIAEITDELEIAPNQFNAALALVTKKFTKAQTGEEIYRQKGKIYRYLQSKGYNADIIYQVFAAYYTS